MADGAEVYRAWASRVKNAGGVATTLPGTKVPAGRYPVAVYTTRVQSGEWSKPDGTTSDGAYGYYAAPEDVQRAAGELHRPTDTEARSAADQLSRTWFDALQERIASLGTLAYWAVVVAAVVVAAIAVHHVHRKLS